MAQNPKASQGNRVAIRSVRASSSEVSGVAAAPDRLTRKVRTTVMECQLKISSMANRGTMQPRIFFGRELNRSRSSSA